MLPVPTRDVLLLCVFLAAIHVASSCMCMPSHPQTDICREDSFVALVRVRQEEFLADKTLSRQKKSPRPESLIVDRFEGEHRNEAPKKVGKDVSPITPAEYEEDILDIAKKSEDVGNRVRYRVKLYKAYKGLSPSAGKKQKMYVFTSSDEGLCGRRLRKRETYLLVGNVVNGSLNVGLCNHVILWRSLPKSEKKNIRKMMEQAASVCKSQCEVTYCPWSKCKPETKHHCVWNRSMTRMHEGLSQANYICSPNNKGGCSWKGVVGKKIGKRQRRHNSAKSARRHQQRISNGKARKNTP